MTLRASPALVIVVFVAVALSSACSSLRLHDAGRHAAAQKATELAAEVEEGELGFDAMLGNVDAVSEVRSEILALHRANELEAVVDDLPELLNEDAAAVIEESVTTHVEARNALHDAIATAVADVNTSLDRQKTIKALLKEEQQSTSSLEGVIDRIDARLEWLDEQVDKAREILDDMSFDDADAGEDAFGEDLEARIADYRETLDGIRNDENVADARKLFAQLKREVTQLETERLLAFRAYLRRLETLRDTFERRDAVFYRNILVPAIAALDGTQADALEAAVDALPPAAPGEPDPHWSAAWESNWAPDFSCGPWTGDATLAEYIATADTPPSIDGCGPVTSNRRLAVGLVERLMLLQFSELSQDENLLIELERTRHRESLGISSINARQHLSLVHQVTEALQIYYAGGLLPEDVASLVLAATQVGALVYIGDNVN